MKIEDIVTNTEGLKKLLDFVASNENIIPKTLSGHENVACFYIPKIRSEVELFNKKYVVEVSTEQHIHYEDYAPYIPKLFEVIKESLYKNPK